MCILALIADFDAVLASPPPPINQTPYPDSQHWTTRRNYAQKKTKCPKGIPASHGEGGGGGVGFKGALSTPPHHHPHPQQEAKKEKKI